MSESYVPAEWTHPSPLPRNVRWWEWTWKRVAKAQRRHWRAMSEATLAAALAERDRECERAERLREVLRQIIANRVEDLGPCDYGPGCDCSECIARAALAAGGEEGTE